MSDVHCFPLIRLGSRVTFLYITKKSEDIYFSQFVSCSESVVKKI